VVAGLAGAFVGGVPMVEAVAIACAAWIALGSRGLVAAAALAHARAQAQGLTHGIVFKEAAAFDAAGRAAIAVVCSRGTVLTGEPEIVALETIGSGSLGGVPSDGGRPTPLAGGQLPGSEAHILALAAGAEAASTHPFATAILRAARARGVTPESVRSTTIHEGLGVTALVGAGDRLVVGSRAFLLQEKVSVAVADARAQELEAQGRSVLLVALAGKLVGLVALQDGLRAGARAAVQRLLDARIEPVLLSGESRETCETIARALDIDHVRPEVLPGERGGEVRALGEGGHVVAVIGHPSSDDGALGAADVAVAMTASRGANEWAVSLASDDVRDAALALSLPHGARERARAALALGLAPGVVALLAVASGVAPVVLGPLAMALGVALAFGAAQRPD
jgi:cation transport ATPase